MHPHPGNIQNKPLQFLFLLKVLPRVPTPAAKDPWPSTTHSLLGRARPRLASHSSSPAPTHRGAKWVSSSGILQRVDAGPAKLSLSC